MSKFSIKTNSLIEPSSNMVNPEKNSFVFVSSFLIAKSINKMACVSKSEKDQLKQNYRRIAKVVETSGYYF